LEVPGGREVAVEGGSDVPTASAVAFSTDGDWLAAAGSIDQGVRVYRWHREGGGWTRRDGFTVPEWQVWGVGFVPNSRILALAAGNAPEDRNRATVHLWDVTTGEKCPGPEGPFTRTEVGPSLAFARSTPLAAVSSHGTVQSFRLPDWKPADKPIEVKLGGAPTELRAIALSPDGRYLVGGWNVEVWVWRIGAPNEPVCMARHASLVNTVVITPDGRTALSGGDDGRVFVRDLSEAVR